MMFANQRWFRWSCLSALMAGAAIIMPTEANAQLFSRLFQRRCCPDPCPQYRALVYTQPTCCGYGAYSTYQNHTHGSNYSHAQYGVGQPINGGIVTTPHGNFANLGVYSSNQVIPDAAQVYSTTPGYAQSSGQAYSSTGSYDPTKNYVPNQTGISGQSQSAQRVQSTMQEGAATSDRNWSNTGGWNRNGDSAMDSRDRQSDRSDSDTFEGAADTTGSDNAFSPPQVDQEWSQSSNSDTSTEKAGESLTTLYAGKLYLANHCAVELSKMAEEMTSTPEVRQFAETIAKDHAALNEKLKPHVSTQVASTFSVDSNSDMSTEIDGGSQVAEDDSGQGRTVAGRANMDVSTDPLVQKVTEVEQDAAKAALQASKDMLNKYSGDDFDMGYVGLQIAHHTAMMAQLQALEDVGTPEFQDLVDQAMTTLERHRAAANELQKALAPAPAADVASDGIAPSANR